MKIAIFTNNYLPNPFGVSMSIESFRKEFKKLGHSVYIFAPDFKGYVDEDKSACLGSSRVFRYPALDLKFKNVRFPIAFPYSYRVDRILEKLEIDVIHSQHPNLLGWQARRWAKKKNVPLVFTWHTLYDQYAHFAPFIPSKLAAWWTIKNAVGFANNADQIVTPTPSVTKIIKKWGVYNSNISSVITGVDENDFANSNREDYRREYEIEDDEIVVGLVSRLTAEKNVIFLAKAVLSVLKKNKKIIFALAGDGSELDAIKKIFNNEKIDSRQFRYFGVVRGQTKIDVYSMIDIFVCASKSETQGMIISEAMYVGLPIVAVGATGVSDLITNQVNGLLVKENEEEFANAIERLASDRNLRIKFSENAKRIAKENYTASVCTQKMLKIYEKAISRKK